MSDSPNHHDERLYTLREVARAPDSPLAGRISTATLYRLAKEERLPGLVRVGRKLFVTTSGIREFVSRGGAR
jgi:predicted DNA-binding transcriptional regulator AlpA